MSDGPHGGPAAFRVDAASGPWAAAGVPAAGRTMGLRRRAMRRARARPLRRPLAGFSPPGAVAGEGLGWRCGARVVRLVVVRDGADASRGLVGGVDRGR